MKYVLPPPQGAETLITFKSVFNNILLKFSAIAFLSSLSSSNAIADIIFNLQSKKKFSDNIYKSNYVLY